ncbi:MAG: hypothetical protein GXX99_04170 [Clostridiales bacterium]|nr:hypothetical protein [Clostridiales bacterium]
MNRGELLDRYAALPGDRMWLGHLLDLAQACAGQDRPGATRFLDPRQQGLAAAVLRAAGIPVALWGGFEGAERRVAVFLNDWDPPPEAVQAACRLLPLRAETATEGLTHRDYLGALMGLQLGRERIGDLLVEPLGAVLLVCEDCADFLCQNLIQAGRARLTLRPLAPGEPIAPALPPQELRVTVSSPRLDGVLGAAFRLSRGRAQEQIAAGRVQVNGLICQKPDRALREGDAVTLRGSGRFRLHQVAGQTKKGRLALLLHLDGRRP